MRDRANLVAALVVGAAVLLIVVATLKPLPGTPPVTATWCLFCGQYGGTDFVLNVGLFVPLGVGLGLTRLRRGRALAAIVLLTLGVELLQVRFIAGRDASLGDVVANTLGGTIGLSVIRAGSVLWRPEPRAALGLTVAYTAIWLALMTASSWLMQPSIPHLMYGSQWQPRHREFFPFTGRLLDLSLNGYRLEPATMIELRREAPPLSHGVEDVVAVLRAGPAPPTLAPIARLGQQTAEAFLLGRDGQAVTFRTRLRAADARLRVPMLALDDGFARTTADDTVRVVAGLRDGALYAQLEHSDHVVSRVMPLTPGLGWSTLLPFNAPLGGWTRWAAAAWIAASLLPLGFWSARSRFAPAAVAALVMLGVVGVMVVGLIVVPRMTGGQAVSGLEFTTGMAGLMCGVLVALAVDHKHSSGTRNAHSDDAIMRARNHT